MGVGRTDTAVRSVGPCRYQSMGAVEAPMGAVEGHGIDGDGAAGHPRDTDGGNGDAGSPGGWSGGAAAIPTARL